MAQTAIDKSIVSEQWTIRSQHRPILSEDEHDALVGWLGDEEGIILLMTPQYGYIMEAAVTTSADNYNCSLYSSS